MFLPEIVQVAVEQTAFHFDKPYSYTWPRTLGKPERGCRVLVPFGGGNRHRQAVVVSCGEVASAPDKLKPVLMRLDDTPLFTDEMLELAYWMRERTFCTVFEALQAMLPPGMYIKVTPRYALSRRLKEFETDDFNDVEWCVMEELEHHPQGLSREEIEGRLVLHDGDTTIDRLSRQGVLVRLDEAARSHGDATIRMVRPAWESEEELREFRLSDKQKAVASLLQEVGCGSVKEICYFCSVTPSVIATMQKKGAVVCYEAEVLRSPVETEEEPPLQSAVLNEEQQRAFNGLKARLDAYAPAAALLYGVTGSGKTQVYMNLMDETLRQGRQVLVLVPEISLTPQMMTLFIRRYGRRVAVLHSGLSIGERMDEWKRIRRGDASIVIGTRSAVFAPLSNLGLLVMDEEQEHTYKSENAPRYHARDIARYRCAKQNALLLLTSATPSVETYYRAISGRYDLYTLSSRYGEAQLPAVKIVDMREQPMTGSVSEPLRQEIERCLQNGKQAILLLNRRGYHTFLSCRSCGHVITCPSCSISMTYHQANRQLVCHYCGHMHDPIFTCPECGSDKVRYSGLGTQRVEEELQTLFPQARILRMDADTTMSKFAYEQKFGAFGNGEYDIMIGTQMVAKGLDFPQVGLVGVLSADQSLYGDDYRSYETTFSLLTQVIGRAGRKSADGLAVIQTYTPENYVIDLAARQDYNAFFETEITARKMMKYPPFTDLFQIGFVGKYEPEVCDAAARFLKLLRRNAQERFSDVPMIVLDATPATPVRVSGKYRYKLLVKAVNNAKTRECLGTVLSEFCRLRDNKNVTAFMDINPASML